jgi:hypothetical protein
MSESFIEPDSLNTIFQNLSAVVDDDGATKFLNSEISSFNFDGFIPLETDTIDVSELKSGMQFILIGDDTNSIRTALKIEFDDPEMTDFPTNDYIISYLGPNGDIQTVTYDGNSQIEVYYEDWENKVLGNTGWTITQAGNAIFSNVAVRGRIEATEGFLEDLEITGTLSVQSGGSIEVGNNPGTPGNAGIVIDDTGIFAYDDDQNITLSIDAETGEVSISALDQAIEDLEEFVGDSFDDLDSLLSSSYVANFQIFNPGTTLISGNKISTGVINAASVTISSGAGGATQGIKITAEGLSAYDIGGVPTFFLNSANGNATFRGTISGSEVVGSTFKSNANITANTGNGIYLDNLGQVRLASNNATLTFNSSGLSLSGAGLTIGGTNPDNFLEAADVGPLGTTTISGSRITTGSINAGLVVVSNLNATNITTGSLSGDRISGGTITGTKIQTNATGTRIRISDDVSTPFGTDDAIEFMDGSFSRTVLAWNSSGAVFDFFGPFFQFTGRNGISATYVDVNGTLEANFVTSNGSIRALGTGSQIAPATFTNAQTALQIRVSDQVIGIQSSTLDIKTNIIPLNEETLSIVPEEKDGGPRENLSFDPNDIFTISPVEYVVIEDEAQSRQVGFIVEDLLEKWPQAVTYGQDNTPVSYNTNSIVAGLVYAVKTLRDRIDYLENKINKLGDSNG